MDQRSDGHNTLITVIKPRSGWQVIDFKELNEYRDMFFSMVTRQIKTLYAQTILGFSWAIFRPLIQIIVFTFIFGKVARVSTEGIPYFLFSSVAIIPWTYMSQTMSESSESLVSGQGMLGKIYFPRLVFPLTPVFSRLVDFGFSVLIILVILFYYRVMPTWNLLFFPLFLIMMMIIPAGIGLWLSTLAIRFRDVKHAMPFVLQMLIYTAPIVYSASSIPEKYRLLYSLNPIVGVIEGYRACLLGTPIPWIYVGPGIITAVLLMISGAFYFRRMERIIVDVI
jgi:lipopolysaccharide transport system permease protein